MADTVTVVDYLWRDIVVGAEVYVVDTFDPQFPNEPPAIGTVEAITNFEGDVDDDTGRSITIMPKVRVRFSPDEVVEFNTSGWRHDPNFEKGKDMIYDDIPSSFDSLGMCEDLSVTNPNEEL